MHIHNLIHHHAINMFEELKDLDWTKIPDESPLTGDVTCMAQGTITHHMELCAAEMLRRIMAEFVSGLPAELLNYYPTEDEDDSQSRTLPGG